MYLSPLARYLNRQKITSPYCMIDQLHPIKEKFRSVEEALRDPTLFQRQKEYIARQKEYKKLGKIVEKIAAYEEIEKNIEENKKLLKEKMEEELLSMAKEEQKLLQEQRTILEEELKKALIPADPSDEKDVILELRAGTGGDEAAIWVGDLFRMYKRYIETQGWKLTIADFTQGTSGGYKEIVATVSGDGIYGMLKYESGVHRVQRVPATETQGRLHTSAASVVVLPEVDDVEVVIDMKDIKKETFCSSGPGGQSVNTTYSAVRLTYIPDQIVVSCQDEKSQLRNYDKAMRVLRARLHEKALKKQQDERSSERKSMVGTQDRSAKIRTYNYPRGAITDHRIHHTQHNLTAFLDGDIGGMIEKLRLHDEAQKLENSKKEL